MKRVAVTTLAISFALLAGCSDSNVVLQGPNGGKQLAYDASSFRPQVETPEDIGILVSAAGKTLQDAAADRSMVTVTEIQQALNASDWRTLERVVVMYRGSHKR